MKSFPKYERPPIIELVLGVQFSPIPGFTSGHSGWFWNEHLGSEWSASDAPPLPEQTESFGPPVTQSMRFELHSAISPRLMAEHESGAKLIQVQGSRFHYNWKKRDSSYPHYETVFQEFNQHLQGFRLFVETKAKLGAVSLNQWEITYLDSVPKGSLWNDPSEWPDIFPALFPRVEALDGMHAEQLKSELIYEISPKRGRLNISGSLAMVNDEQTLLVRMTARGPIHKESRGGLDSIMSVGHDAIGTAFDRATSAKAKAYWGPLL